MRQVRIDEFKKRDQSVPLGQLKSAAMKLVQLYDWLQEFADIPATKASFIAAIHGRMPHELWNSETNQETSKIKEMKEFHAARIEHNPDWKHPTSPSISYYVNVKSPTPKFPEKAAECSYCGKVMSSKYALKEHNCFINFSIPIIPALPKNDLFFSCPGVNPNAYKFRGRKFRIFTNLFEKKGKWENGVFMKEPTRHAMPKFDIKFSNRRGSNARVKRKLCDLTAKPIIWLS